MRKLIANIRTARRQVTQQRLERCRAEYTARFEARHGRARVDSDEGMYI